MHFQTLIHAAALLCFANAQRSSVPEGFVPATNSRLEVIFNSTTVQRPGELLSKAATATQPQIALPASVGNTSATYMFVMLDLDVPPQQGSTKRRVLLHALNTGFRATRQRVNGSSVVLASPQKGPANYLPPSPPATDTVPHRYVQLLFQQPASLSIQSSAFTDTTARFNFDISKFATDSGLGRPIAGNFFTVDGRASSPSTTGTGGAPRRTSQPFEGAASRYGIPDGWAMIIVFLLGAWGF